jgi:UDP-GlcNAc:undecaprenyl-phosphate GlcNAc-1-phosphate transferase
MLLASALGAVLTAVGVLMLIKYAEALSLLDTPCHRSAHSRPIPRGAGIAFVGVSLLALALFDQIPNKGFWWIYAAIILILATGILDDLHEVSPRFKFLGILAATALIWEGGLRIDHVGNYLGFDLSLGWLAFPFTYFAVAGFTNAMNLIDGLDGLAGGASWLILAFFFWLGWNHHDHFLLFLSSIFLVSVTIFLWFNWHPAKIFMGDSGSLSLGFLISALSIYALRYIPSVTVLFIGLYPIVDTLVAMVRRKRSGRSASHPDRCHIHHLILNRFGSVPKTVLLILSTQALGLLVAALVPRGVDQAPLLLLFALIVLITYRWVRQEIRRQDIAC